MEFVQVIIAAAMILLCIVCIAGIARVLRQILGERESKEAESTALEMNSEELSELIERTATALADARTDKQPEVREEPRQTEPPAEEGVIFGEQRSMEEKYAALGDSQRQLFDLVVSHALSKDGARELKFSSYYDYKIGAYRLLRIKVKRGEIVCELPFLDRDVQDFANAAEVKIKHAAPSVRLTELAAVTAVNEGVDLLVTQIAADLEYKRSLAKERRREKRRKQKELVNV